MKKFMISIAAICAMLFFVSCGGDSSEPKKQGDNQQQNNTEDENGGNNGDNNGGETNNGGENNNGGETNDDGGNNGGETNDDGGNNGGETNDDGGNNGAETNDDGNNDTETNDDDNNIDENQSDPELYEKFTGRWAAKIILHSTSVAAGMEPNSITTRYILVDFSVNDKGQLDMDKVDNRICRTDNRTGDKGSTAAGNVLFNEPDSKFNTIFWHWKPYEISGQENIPYVVVRNNGEKITFKLNQDFELRGACKEKESYNPKTEPWFTNKKDSRIFDHDDDGHPAFTIGFKGSAITTGDMYYVQRLWHVFEGELKPNGDKYDKIEGNVDWSDEQLVVDASNFTLNASKKTTTHKDKSIFQFKKVADDMNCDALLGQFNTVFDIVDPHDDEAYGRD